MAKTTYGKNQMSYEIIDFHTHPFDDDATNFCSHKEYCNMSAENTVSYLKGLGISKICGSVVCRNIDHEVSYANEWEMIADSNRRALILKEQYGDFYIPGFHVHPSYVRESCEEIEKMSKLGVRLIGELVPYIHGWQDYTCKGFDEILEVATVHNMIVSFHSIENDKMDEMVRKHPDTILVAAHPGEYPTYIRHLERMKMSDNYYLDLSGTGLFRHGMLRRGIDELGPERFLFGSDYPVCNPAMFLGGVVLDTLLTEEEKVAILGGNARKLLGLDSSADAIGK
ncbi:MAG: amidohydrolase [Clostridiales bacterium]|nr:amidohydrolase [Clostridiales bacterium]